MGYRFFAVCCLLPGLMSDARLEIPQDYKKNSEFKNRGFSYALDRAQQGLQINPLGSTKRLPVWGKTSTSCSYYENKATLHAPHAPHAPS
jgi:hypothetical protein